MVDVFRDVANNTLNIVFAGSMWFGIFWLLLFCWLAPKKLWFYLWMMFLFLTFLAYGHEAMKKHQASTPTTSDRYDAISHESL